MENAHTATARGDNFPVSRKHSIEVANFVRGKSVKEARRLLGKVLRKEMAVPFKRFFRDKGHKRNIASGRFPENATKTMLDLIDSAESNAQNKGLNTSSLVISSLMVNKGNTQWRYGRQKRRQMKKCHISLTLSEKTTAKKETKKEDKPKADKK